MTGRPKAEDVFKIPAKRNCNKSETEEESRSVKSAAEETLHTTGVVESNPHYNTNVLKLTHDIVLASNTPYHRVDEEGGDQTPRLFCPTTSGDDPVVKLSTKSSRDADCSSEKSMDVPIILQSPPSPTLKEASAASCNCNTSKNSNDIRSGDAGGHSQDGRIKIWKELSVNRLYQSADQIHNITRCKTSDSDTSAIRVKPKPNDLGNYVQRRCGDLNQHRHHPNRNSHGHQHNSITSLQPIPGSPTALSKNQAVSLFGINGYLNLHPHHRSSPHGSNTYRHYHSRKHHSHNHHHLGGSRSDVAMHINKGLLNPILRKDVYYSGSIQHLSAYQQHGSMTSFLAAMTRCSSSEENLDTTSSDVHGKAGSPCGLLFNRCFPLWLLRDKVFLLLLVTFTMWTAQSVTLTYLPGYAVSLGIDRSQAAWLISIIGVANVLGRLVSGFITDCLPIQSIWLYVFALSLAAAINFIIPSLTSFFILAIAAGLFGICMGGIVSMRTIVLADQMGIGVLTESFGIVAFLQGVAFTIVPPIAGRMIDDMGSSRPAFWLSAGMYTLSATTTLWAALIGRNDKFSAVEVKDPVDT